MKRKQTFDEKNELITVRPKKIIEQVRTFDGESDFIVPRKNTYIDKKNNTIVSLARDNSHSSVDTVGEYANAAAAAGGGSPTGGANIVYTVQTIPSTPTCQGIGINVNAGGATGGNILVGGGYTATNQSGQIVASQTITQNGKIFNLPLLTDASGTLLDANVVYTISLSYNDDDGSGVALPVQTAISGQLNCTTSGTGSTGGGTGQAGQQTGNVGAPTGIKNTNQQVVQVTNQFGLTNVTAQVNPVTIKNFQASTAVLQPDTISVNVSYDDGQAPYTVDYTIIDQNGVVTVQQPNNTSSLQDSLQPSPSGLSTGQYTVTVKVTGADGTSDSRTEIVKVDKKQQTIKGNLKINNLNVTTTNPTTSGFDVNLSWSDGTSPYQVNGIVKSSGFASNHVMSESSKTHSWTQSLLVDNSGNPIYGNYDIGVEVTDSIGDVVQGFTQIFVPAPKPKPLSGILTETNKQNASFDVDYKFYNGVAPYTLTATLFHPVDASGNSQSFPINEVNLTNNGVFPVIITPMAGGAVLEGYYKMINCVVTDANGQTANLNDLSVYLNGVKANIAPPPPPPPTTTTTPTPIIGGGGSVIIGGGGGGVVPTVEPVVVAPKEKTGINWLLVIIALGVGYAIIRKKQ